MVDYNRYNLLSFFLAIIIYLSIVFFIFYKVYDSKRLIKKYAMNKNNSIEISIIQEKRELKPKTKKSVPIKKQEKKSPEKKVKKKVDSPKKAKKDQDIKSLFSTIKSDKFKKVTDVKRKSDIQKASRLKKKAVTKNEKKGTKAKDLIKNLNLKTIEIKKRGGGEIINEYIAKVQTIIDDKWQKTISTVSGAKGEVLIKIDKSGKFEYKILKLSYNNVFNAKLKDFLDTLTVIEFPPSPKGELFEFETILRDEKEG